MSRAEADALADELVRLAMALFDAEQRVRAVGRQEPKLRAGADKAEAFIAAAKVAVIRMSDAADNAAFIASAKAARPTEPLQ